MSIRFTGDSSSVFRVRTQSTGLRVSPNGLRGADGTQGEDGAPGIDGVDAQAYRDYADPTGLPTVVGTLSGGRVVAVTDGALGYAEPSVTATLWLTTRAVTSPIEGDDLLSFGPLQDGGPYVPEQPVYLASNGFLTQTAPITGVLRVVGYAIDDQTIHFDPQPGIQLA